MRLERQPNVRRDALFQQRFQAVQPAERRGHAPFAVAEHFRRLAVRRQPLRGVGSRMYRRANASPLDHGLVADVLLRNLTADFASRQ